MVPICTSRGWRRGSECRVSCYHLHLKNGPDIPVVRFPEMYSCPTCRRLEKHSFFCENDDNKCNSCNAPLVPSRFVVCCPKGHINDFPYFNWVHAGAARSQTNHVLKIESKELPASLRDININCGCGAAPELWRARSARRRCKASLDARAVDLGCLETLKPATNYLERSSEVPPMSGFPSFTQAFQFHLGLKVRSLF